MRVATIERETRDTNFHEVYLRLEGPETKRDLSSIKARDLGRYGEEVAATFLSEQGIDIVERNWSCSFGEVDLVGEDEGGIVLVEVKTRRSSLATDEVAPELSVDSRKRYKYQRLALLYLSLQTRFDAVRFDVVALQMPNAREARLRHLQRAYEWDR